MTTLFRMTDSDYADYVAEAIPSYAAEKVASGQWPQDEALVLSKKSLDELLPQGKDTPDNHLFVIRDEQSVAVGILWFAVQDRAGKRIAYVYDVSIKPEYRRRGHAVCAFLALESEVRAQNLSGVALHVFGHNTAAHAMYVKLGYVPTNINMFKPLPSIDA